MTNQLQMELAQYLKFLTEQPETRINNSLIDCTIHLMQQKADTL